MGTTASGTTIASGAAIDFQGVAYSTTEALTVNAGAIKATTGTSSFAGGVTLGGNSSVDIGGAELTLSGAITDGTSTFGITKTGSGTLVLTASGGNSYDGATTISAGTVAVTVNSGLGSTTGATTVASGATLDFRNINYSTTESVTVNGGTIATSTGTSTLAGGVTLGANSTFSIGGVQLTQSGVITDGVSSFTLTKSGAGTLVLSADNTYDGGTTINAGTVSIGKDLALGNVPNSTAPANITFGGGSLAITTGFTMDSKRGITLNTGGGTIEVASSQTLTYAGIITGENAFTKTGLGVLTLSGANTFNGITTLSAGTLRVGANSALGGGSLALNGGTLASDSGTARTLANSVTIGADVILGETSTGTGALNFSSAVGLGGGTRQLTVNQATTFSGAVTNGNLTKAGSAQLTLGNANTSFGTLTVNSGTVSFSENGVITGLLGAGTVNIASTKTLTSTLTTDSTFSGLLTGTGTLTKAGANALNLSGASSDYAGAINVNAGVLEARDSSALGTSAGATTVASGAQLKLYNATGNITLADNFNISGTGVGGVGGAILNTGGNNTISGTITLQSSSRIAADVSGRATSSLSIGDVNASGGAYVIYFGANGANISATGPISGNGGNQDGTITSLFKDGTGTLTLTGANTYSGDTRITQGILTVGSGGNLGNGDSDVFISSGATLNVNADTTVDSVQETANSNGGVISIGTGATLTIDGANKSTFFQNNISGAGNLRMAGSGTTSLGLYGTQNYTGTTTVSGGTLTTGVALSTSGLILDGGVFETTGANIISNSSSVTINGGEFKFGNDSTDTDVVGTLAGSGGKLTLNAQMTTTSSANSSYAGNISGSQGMVKQGTGILTLTGVSDGTGSFFIDQGGINLNLASGSIGNRSIDVGGGAAGNSVNTSDVTLQVTSGSYNNAITVNSEAGSASAAAGNRTIDFANASGTAILSGAVVLEKTAAVSVASGGTGVLSGVISGAGGLTKSGTGNLEVSNANTFDGNVIINGGKVKMSHATALGDTGTITVNAGADLEVDGGITVARNLTLSAKDGVIRGGRLMSSGASKNTFSGTVAVNNSDFDVASGNTLDVTGKISGTGTVTKTGAGELQLSNTGNDYSGITDVQNGTLTASSIANSGTASTIGTGSEVKVGSASTEGTFKYTGSSASMNRTVTVGSAGGTINVNDSAATMTLTGALAGSTANLTKTGAGKLALGSGSSTTVSTIAIQQGTLLLGASSTIGDSTGITMSGGTLDTAGYSDQVGQLKFSGSNVSGAIIGLSSSNNGFLFSSLDTSAGSIGSLADGGLTFRPSATTLYSTAGGLSIKLSTADWVAAAGGSTTLNGFNAKVSFADGTLASQISFSGGVNGTYMNVAAIPEPKVYVAAGALALLIGLAEFRRRKRAKSAV